MAPPGLVWSGQAAKNQKFMQAMDEAQRAWNDAHNIQNPYPVSGRTQRRSRIEQLMEMIIESRRTSVT
jgi:hypothetical protein